MLEKSAYFNSFVCSRCDEIIGKDKTHQKINKSILRLENKLRKTLNKEQLRMFNDYESMVIKLSTYAEILLYKQGYLDGVGK